MPSGTVSRESDLLAQPLHSGISIIDLVDTLTTKAVSLRASDIHLDPTANGLRVRMRIDGALSDICDIPKEIQAETVARIKVLSHLRTDEHQATQDGRFRTALSDNHFVDVRVSIVPVHHGERAVLRLLPDVADEFTLDSLGFTAHNREKIIRALVRPFGMILATGPTGSGKTTTLYTLIKMLNAPGTSIITIEDPVEYAIAGINQIQINTRTHLTFDAGLRAIVRQDPDIIMVGEIRDTETAGLAVNVALTGHLILSTLHTNDAPTTLPRLLDMKIEPYLVASTVTVAIGQRLVRRICAHCKQERSISPSVREYVRELIDDGTVNANAQWYAGGGCDACAGSGYRGRVGIHEVLELNQEMRDAIVAKASADTLRTIALEQGMVPMLTDGLHKAAQGLTTIEEVLRVRYA